MMNRMMAVCEPGVHIEWQYIHINEIWQDVTAPDFDNSVGTTELDLG